MLNGIDVDNTHEVSDMIAKINGIYGDKSDIYKKIRAFYKEQVDILKNYKKTNNITTTKELYESLRYPADNSLAIKEYDYFDLKYNGDLGIRNFKVLLKRLCEVKEVILKDYICNDCKEHFEQLCEYLDSLNIKYSRNKLLVRGLDYYNRTVFEIKSNNLGSQNAVCGGGRYDGLVQEFGGAPTPAVGFATGVERLMEIYNEYNQNVENKVPDLYILSLGTEENKKSLELAENLRKKGFIVEKDIFERSFKAQMKYADKIKAKNLIVIGENELNQGIAKIKNMATGEEKEISLSFESIIGSLK